MDDKHLLEKKRIIDHLSRNSGLKARMDIVANNWLDKPLCVLSEDFGTDLDLLYDILMEMHDFSPCTPFYSREITEQGILMRRITTNPHTILYMSAENHHYRLTNLLIKNFKMSNSVIILATTFMIINNGPLELLELLLSGYTVENRADVSKLQILLSKAGQYNRLDMVKYIVRKFKFTENHLIRAISICNCISTHLGPCQNYMYTPINHKISYTYEDSATHYMNNGIRYNEVSSWINTSIGVSMADIERCFQIPTSNPKRYDIERYYH